jgi:hypothetical protein
MDFPKKNIRDSGHSQDSCGLFQKPVCTPVLHDTEGAWLHAVDGPGCVALRIADGDAESAVVGPHQAHRRAWAPKKINDIEYNLKTYAA